MKRVTMVAILSFSFFSKTYAQCPSNYSVTGSATVCRNTPVTITLAGSQTNTTYQLKEQHIFPPSTDNIGAPLTGTGSSLTWQVSQSGTFIVVAKNITSGCEFTMTQKPVISYYGSPGLFALTANKVCESNVTFTLDGSELGVNYQLLVNGNAILLPQAGTESSLTWSGVNGSGTFSVVATTSNGCSSTMQGTPLIKPQPSLFNISTTDISGCEGQTKHIQLSNSESGYSYQVYETGFAGIPSQTGSPVVGIGGPVGLPVYLSTSQPYTVRATEPTGSCSRVMSGQVTITTYPSPSVFAISTSDICVSPVTISLPGSQTATTYVLTAPGYTSSKNGTGSAISWSVVNIPGTYSIQAQGSNGCTAAMYPSSLTLHPIIDNITVSGSCSGGLSFVTMATSQIGIKYQLRQQNPSFTDVGPPKVGNGSALSWQVSPTILQSYQVVAIDDQYGCTREMPGGILVPPVVNVFNVNSNSKCVGAKVSLSGFDVNVTYQLKKNGVNVGSPIMESGAGISWSNLSSGIYSVDAIVPGTGCVVPMYGTQAIGPSPQLYTVSGDAAICDDAFSPVSLSSSETGFAYQLQKFGTFGNMNVGAPLPGTGGVLTWNPQSLSTTQYVVVGTEVNSGCQKQMISDADVTIKTTPVAYLLHSSQTCASWESTITLDNSQSESTYSLIRDGSVVNTLTGAGGVLEWSYLTTGGAYSVKAVNSSTLCERMMTGSVILNPAPTAYPLTAGPHICQGENTSFVLLGNTDVGISYQLYKDDVAFGAAISGTGGALNIPISTAGMYYVIATNPTTSCYSYTGGVSIVAFSIPTIYSTSLAGNCSWYSVNLDGSQPDIVYYLYHDGLHVSTKNGTESALSWTNESQFGVYNIQAVNGTCLRAMTNAVSFNSPADPIAYSIGNTCENSTRKVFLSSSATDVRYQLRKHSIFGQANNVGSPQPGTGGIIKYVVSSTGTYSIMATNIYTNCSHLMNGTTSISSLSCSSFARLKGPTEVDEIQGVEEDHIGSSVFYPNPATQELFMDLPDNLGEKIKGVEIYDLLGSRIKTEYGMSANVLKIEIHNLNSGAYVAKISTPSKVILLRFIKR